MGRHDYPRRLPVRFVPGFFTRAYRQQEVEDVSSKYSCASTSREWFEKGFGSATDTEVSNVHYITQNPFLSRLALDRFHDVEALWEADGKNGRSRLPPSAVTDVALDAYRSTDADRLVVHYLPPHAPFLHCEEKYNLEEKSWGGETHDVWFGLQTGRFEHEEVWEDYGENLLTVLDEVERLTTHVSGRVVVTADHANGMGEFGQYGHPGYVPLPAIKRVPWVEMTGEGQEYETTELQKIDTDSNGEEQAKQRLESLGYI